MREQQQELKKDSDNKDNKKPAHQFRAGVISVSLWENEGKEFDGKPSTFFTAKVQRSYKDKKDQWQHTDSLRVNDIPVVQMLLQKAFEAAKMKTDKDD